MLDKKQLLEDVKNILVIHDVLYDEVEEDSLIQKELADYIWNYANECWTDGYSDALEEYGTE